MESVSPESSQSEWHPVPSDELTHMLPDRDGMTAVERLEAGRPQLEELVAAMAPDIRAGRWDVILGDDVSGRIPTLILRQVIAHVYADQHREAPKTYFVAMGQEFSFLYDEEQENYYRVLDVNKYLGSGERPQKVLFVTDNVAHGGSIQTVQEALDSIGVSSDVASVQEMPIVLQQQTREHAEHDPDYRWYGVEYPVQERGGSVEPFHSPRSTRNHTRDAIGVEKYGGPTAEGKRHHEIRALNDGRLVRDERVPLTPEVAEFRKAASRIAEDLYRKFFAVDEPHASGTSNTIG